VNSQSGSSSGASFNLTVVLGDGVATVVGASPPEVGLPAGLPGIISSEPARTTTNVISVTEPICLHGCLSEKIVEPRTPTLVSCSAPGVSSDVGLLTLVSCGPGTSVGAVVPSENVETRSTFAFGRSVTQAESDNWSPRAQNSANRNSDVDDGYFYDEYAVCSDMLHDRNENMFPHVFTKLSCTTCTRGIARNEENVGSTTCFSSHSFKSRARLSLKPKSQALSKAFSRASGVNLSRPNS